MVITVEAKRVEMRRLSAAGQWTEADVFKEEVRTRLRAEGASRKEAAELAWETMLEKYPAVAPLQRFADRLTGASDKGNVHPDDWFIDVEGDLTVELQSAPTLSQAVALHHSRSELLDNDGKPLAADEAEKYASLSLRAGSSDIAARIDVEVELAVRDLSRRFDGLEMSQNVTDAIARDLVGLVESRADHTPRDCETAEAEE